MEVRYSPTQLRLLKVLGDGKQHSKEELYACCAGPQVVTFNTLNVHMCLLRKRLKKDSVNGSTLNVIPVYGVPNMSFQLVIITQATVKDIKSLPDNFSLRTETQTVALQQDGELTTTK